MARFKGTLVETAGGRFGGKPVDAAPSLAMMDTPPEGAVPGSRAYADWARARAMAGFKLPEVGPRPPDDVTRSLPEKLAAFTASAAEAVPIAGPSLRKGLEGLRSSVQGLTPEQVARETQIAVEANPATSTAGAITGTVAPFVLASTLPVVSTILGVDVAAPLAVNVLAGAASQKAISHLDTLARGGDPNETIEIAGFDVKPEDVAGALGVAGPFVGKAVGAGINKLGEAIEPVKRFVQGAFSPEAAAESAITRAAGIDAAAGVGGLSAADEAAAIAAGQPVINADRFGTATRTLARTAANTDPTAREMLSEFVQDRFLTQNTRAADWVRRNTGAPTNIYAVQQNMAQSAKGVNNAAYRTAYTAPGAESVWTPEIEQLMQSENFRKAITSAVKSSNEEAALQGSKGIQNPFVVDPKTGSYRLRTDAAGNTIEPSLEFWDHVQRQLRQKASRLAQQGKNFDAGQVFRARSQLNEVLDAAVPEFATARGGAARWFGAEDALEAGQKFVGTSLTDMDAARAAYAKFSPQERKLFASGFASSLLDNIGRTGDSVNVINKVFASPQSRAQISLALGPKAAAELEPFLRVESAMQMTKQAVQGGSNTAQQLAAMAVKLGGSNAGVGYGSGAAFGGLDPRQWGTKAWTAAMLGFAGRAGMRSLAKSVDSRTMQEIAKVLASEDPKLIEKVIQRAAHSPKSAEALKAIEYGLSLLTRAAAPEGEPAVEGDLTE
jgi:hypothetical protein